MFLLPPPPKRKSDDASLDSTAYAALPTEESNAEPVADLAVNEDGDQISHPALSIQEKWELVKPLLGKFMLPLCEKNEVLLRLECSDNPPYSSRLYT
jgi:hypothetical protein